MELNIGNEQYRDEIEKLVFTYSPTPITRESPVELKIILRSEVPIYQSPRRLPSAEKQLVDKQIEEWLNDSIIQPSVSDFASPVVLVNKKDGGKRLCIDYRKLNKEVIMDRYPLPVIEDQIDQLYNAVVFTTLDLKNGFFHVPVSVKSRKYTSFVTPRGQFEFLRMPFGLCSAPAVFSRYIIYMDDIIIPSEDEDDNLKTLKIVLAVASEYDLQIKWEKCTFLDKNIEYLGYQITKGTITPSKSKTEAVRKFREPRKLKDVQSYLGLTGYFRKFINNYAEIARPLTDLLRKDVQFDFGPSQRNAFQKLKQCLIEYPVLRIFNRDRETEVHTDASKWGFGAILMQRNSDDQQFHPIYYFSRKTSPAQERYHSYELEVLAIVAALKKFRIYLLGLNFTIVTDCAAFKATMEKKDLLPRIAGWAIFLQDFNYKIEHRSGIRMRHSDALSRNPIVALLEDGLLQRIGNAQQTDDRLRVIRETLDKGPLDPYYLRNGVVYRRSEDGYSLVCIPNGMQQEIIKTVHEKGHFGWKKPIELLKREYYIPHLKEKILSCICNCITCILSERKTGKKEGLLNSIPKDDLPLNTYHLDHLGPLTSTNKQYKYIFTVIDPFSKFVWLYAVKTLTAKEVIQKLEIQKAIFGNPERDFWTKLS